MIVTKNNLSNGGKLSCIPDIVPCNFCNIAPDLKITKINFLTQCVPFYNMILSKMNLFLNDGENTYTIHFEKVNKVNYLINMNENTYTYTKLKYPNDDLLKDWIFTDIIHNFYLSKKIIVNNKEIPMFFLKINCKDIFNLALSQKFNFTDYFRFDSNDNRFIAMSFSFNIFNLALFTHTYIELLQLFVYCFNEFDEFENIKTDPKFNKNTEKEFINKMKKNIKDNLNKTYNKYNNFIVDLYDTIKFKKQIVIENAENNNISCEEKNNNTNFESIVQILTDKLFNMAKFLHDLSKIINDHNYKYIFLMSILSYRLQNKYITGGWAFSIKKTIEQLKNNFSKINYKPKRENFENFFADLDFPIIYEYLTTTYNGKTYGNCMENTILQFLKLVFWKGNGEYDIDLIKIMIKDKYKDRFIKFINDIQNEREFSFINQWTEFITFNYVEYDVGYNFIKSNVELNTIFENLYLACHELFDNNDIKSVDIEAQKEQLLKIFKSNNNFDFLLNINTNSPGTDIIILYFTNKEFTIELRHNIHAYFHGAKSDSDRYIIMNDVYNTLQNKSSIESLSQLLDNNDESYYSNFSDYILLKILFNNFISNEVVLYKYYEKLDKNKILLLFDSIFSDLTISSHAIYFNYILKKQFILDSPLIWFSCARYMKSEEFWEDIAKRDDILKLWIEKDYWDDTVWHVAAKTIKSEKFWEDIAKRDDILKLWIEKDYWDNTVWHRAAEGIKSEKFWEIIANRDDILKLWIEKNNVNNTVWHIAAHEIKSEKFWEIIAEKDYIIELWNKIDNTINKLWLEAVHEIKSEKFWEIIAKRNFDFQLWNKKNNNGIVWKSAIKYLQYEKFWEIIANRDDAFQLWNEEKIWHYAIEKIKFEKFWEIIANRNDVLKSWIAKKFHDRILWDNETVWDYAVEKIKSEKFWEIIANRETYLKTLTFGDEKKLSVWNYLVEKGKIIKKDNIRQTGGKYMHKYLKYTYFNTKI